MCHHWDKVRQEGNVSSLGQGEAGIGLSLATMIFRIAFSLDLETNILSLGIELKLQDLESHF